MSGAPESHLENGKHQELQRLGRIMKMTSKGGGGGTASPSSLSALQPTREKAGVLCPDFDAL